MGAYNIVILQPAGYVHSRCFVEIGKLLLYSFRSLGIPCNFQFNTMDPGGINVVLGYNVLSDASILPQCDFVIYQLEQLSDRDGWFRPAYLEMYQRAREVWDYAEENVAFLRSKGIEHVQLLPIGFHEGLRTIRPASPDVDVLFYGPQSPRRRAVLERLNQLCKLIALFGVYGDERDQWIARSKIVLNMHYSDRQIIEQSRISYLLNNQRFVVSEDSSVNPYGQAVVTAPYDRLVDTCCDWLKKPKERDEMALVGYEHFRKKPMTHYLRQVIESFAR